MSQIQQAVKQDVRVKPSSLWSFSFCFFLPLTLHKAHSSSSRRSLVKTQTHHIVESFFPKGSKTWRQSERHITERVS